MDFYGKTRSDVIAASWRSLQERSMSKGHRAATFTSLDSLVSGLYGKQLQYMAQRREFHICVIGHMDMGSIEFCLGQDSREEKSEQRRCGRCAQVSIKDELGSEQDAVPDLQIEFFPVRW